MANGLIPLGNSTDLTKLTSGSLTTSDQLEAEELAALWLNSKARNLYHSFANARDECPDIVAKNFVTILGKYPPEIIDAVCDPNDGIPSEQKWVSSPKELRDCCEKHHGRVLREQENEIRRERQLRERREDEEFRARQPKEGTVARYLAERRKDSSYFRGHTPGTPASAQRLLEIYLEGRAQHKHRVTLSREARTIIEAAGLEIPV